MPVGCDLPWCETVLASRKLGRCLSQASFLKRFQCESSLSKALGNHTIKKIQKAS